MKVETAFTSSCRLDDSIQGHIIGKHVESCEITSVIYIVNIRDE